MTDKKIVVDPEGKWLRVAKQTPTIKEDGNGMWLRVAKQTPTIKENEHLVSVAKQTSTTTVEQSILNFLKICPHEIENIIFEFMCFGESYHPQDFSIGFDYNLDIKDTDETKFYSFNKQIHIVTVNGNILQCSANLFGIYYKTLIHNNFCSPTTVRYTDISREHGCLLSERYMIGARFNGINVDYYIIWEGLWDYSVSTGWMMNYCPCDINLFKYKYIGTSLTSAISRLMKTNEINKKYIRALAKTKLDIPVKPFFY